MIFLIPIFALFVWGGLTIAPMIAAAIGNWLLMGLWAAGLGLFGIIFLNPKLWSNLAALYSIIMYRMTDAIITIDPIAIIKDYLDDLRKSLHKINDQLDLVKKQENKLQMDIQANVQEISKCRERVIKAQQLMAKTDPTTEQHIEYKTVVAIDSSQAGRLSASNERLAQVVTKISGFRKILERMRIQSNFVLKDMELEVKVRESEFKAVNAGAEVLKSVKALLDGSGVKRELYDKSLEFMKEDLAFKIGQIERFMETSGSILTSGDIDTEILTEKGLNLLDEWNKKGELLQITSPKEALKLTGVTIPSAQPVYAEVVSSTSSRSKYLN